MASRPSRRAKETDVSPRETKIIVERIEALITRRTTTARKVSIDSGLGTTAVSDILSGKNKSPSVVAIKAIAKELKTTVAHLMGETDHETAEPEQRGAYPMPIVAVAEAGAFRKALPFDQGQEADLPTIHGPRSRNYPRARHFALEVRGDSMNAAPEGPIRDGMFALCVDMNDAELTIESGKIYAVRRTLDDGQTWEITIKRVMVYRDRYELVPESTNPAHIKIVISQRSDVDAAREIHAFGLVFAAVTSFE